MSTKRLLVALTAVALLSCGVARAEFSETVRFDADRLIVRNLIGRVDVVSGGGSGFEVEARIQGAAGTRDRVTLDVVTGSTGELTVRFPESRDYVYPALGANSRSSFSVDEGSDGGWLTELIGGLFGGDRITVRGSGRGLEVWADLTIRMPRGAQLEVRHGVGKAAAKGVDGDLKLRVRAGSIDAEGASGTLLFDTGSGHVKARRLSGTVTIDTGSGHVEVEDVDADDFLVDTGSGHVEVNDAVATASFKIDTGSGHVEARGIRALGGALIDTGSGGVELELVEMGRGRYVIDTGSGGVKLTLPANASANVHADTGSGGIDLDLATPIQMTRQSRDEVRFTIGGGESEIRIDTGSGGVRIRQ